MSASFCSVSPSPNRRFAGTGFIAGNDPGIVSVAGAPARRKVVCVDTATGRPVASATSGPDGTYRIENLNPQRIYHVISFDHQDVYNAVIRDGLRPKTP